MRGQPNSLPILFLILGVSELKKILFFLNLPVLTCRAKEEGDDGQVGHVADRRLKGEVQDHEGNAPILYCGLQGNGDNLENGSCTPHSCHKHA